MSKRDVENVSLLEKCLSWCSNNSIMDSVPCFEEEEIISFSNFPETFEWIYNMSVVLKLVNLYFVRKKKRAKESVFYIKRRM